MSPRREQIDHAIAALQAQRALLGDEVVDVAVTALRNQRAALAESEPAQQLRLVSVLFLDVVGSTALSQHLEPEEIQGVMDEALAAFTSLVDRHGGRVMQYAGDSVLAAFGTEEAHEDDAERAVLCGLALLREGRAQAEAVRRRHGWDGFDVRVGISSGDVLLGGGVDGEGTIRGLTVNMAARMEQTAPAGRLRISHDTWRLVRGLFEVEAQAPLAVKGRDEPVQSYLVSAVRAAPAPLQRRGVQGRRVPLVGREAVLAALRAALESLEGGIEAGDGRPVRPMRPVRLVSLLAEAGLGKTRLLDEFVAGLGAGRVQLLRAEALERRRHRPYGLVRALLMSHFGLVDVDGAPVARADWLQRAGAALADEGSAAVLGALLGLDLANHPEVAAFERDARALRTRARFHATELLLAPGTVPLLLALDDLHWADEASLDLLDELLAARPARPVLVLALARPELLRRRPGWGGAVAAHERLELEALVPADGERLVRALLAPLPQVPALLVRQLTEAAEGNPYFLEELVNMLLDQGVIGSDDAGDGARWTLRAERLPSLQLPPTLKGVLQARLSAQPAQARRALQLGAVAGPVFWDLALAALDARATQSLPQLQAAQFIAAQHQSRLDAAVEYAFRHHSVHQVTYASVLRRVRRAAHAVLARWLSGRPDAGALQDQIAIHFEGAEERLPAAAAWQRAAEDARRRFANADALAHAQRALALLGGDEPARRLELLLMLVRVHDGTADRDGMARALDELAALAAGDSADADIRCHLRSWQARWQMNYGETARALALAREAVALAPAARAETALVAHAELLHVLGRVGRVDEVRQAAGPALAAARSAGVRVTEGAILNQLGMSEFDAGEYETAAAHYEQALALHRAGARPDNEAGTLANLAFVHLALGDYALAREQFTRAAELCRRVGQLQHLGIVEINLGLVALNLGEPAVAEAQSLAALARLTAAGDRWAAAAAERVAGLAALALGRADEAAVRCAAAEAVFEELELPALVLEAAAGRLEVALARGDRATGAALTARLVEALDDPAALDGCDEPMRVWCATWRGLRALGDARAEPLRRRACALLDARAARLADPQRRTRFLDGVPSNRALRLSSPG
jgi:class 3 adenylate cyclase/tetratricopeptide (TPR) repeat protein